ncbi:alpha/beta hydrolase [Rathayibacter tritici]|nr:alpha/beta hydrolase [Rathayibacter tritici]PPG06990.1 alpha/beta hydrolase [Rathayibacter tritici]
MEATDVPAPITLDHRGSTLRGWRFGEARRDAPAALVVHGFSDSGTGGTGLMVQTCRELAALGLDVRSYDRLGQGVSDGEFADITLGDEVEQVVAMIRVAASDGDGRVHVVAHSLGAVESAMAAGRVPELIASLTLWSPAGVVVDDITVKDEIEGRPLAPAREQGYVDIGGMALGTAFLDEVRGGIDVYAGVEAFTGAAEVLHGTEDAIVPPEYGRRYADLLPGGSFTLVDGADHGWSTVPLRRMLLDRLAALVTSRRGGGAGGG